MPINGKKLKRFIRISKPKVKKAWKKSKPKMKSKLKKFKKRARIASSNIDSYFAAQQRQARQMAPKF